MIKRIDHVEITTGKMEETMAFYTNVLGFKIKERNKMDRPPLQEIAFLTLGDTMIEILGAKDPAPRRYPSRAGDRGATAGKSRFFAQVRRSAGGVIRGHSE